MKIISTGQAAREKLKRGIDLAVDCIKVTIGPTGRNAVLGRVDIPPYITNDGVSIARHIDAEDESENQGVWIVKEALSTTSNKAGDNTTTTAIFIQAIVDKVFEKLKDDGSLVKENKNPLAIKKELDEACEMVVTKLKEIAKPITDKDIYNVALTAGEFPWIAKIVSDVFKKIGKDGYVTIEEGVETSYEIFKGIEINAGYHSEYYVNKDDKCVLAKTPILVTNNLLNRDSRFVDLTANVVAQGFNQLILVAPDFSKDLLDALITTKLKSGVTVVALRVPAITADETLLDVAALTGAKFIDKNTFTKYEDFSAELKFENLGFIDGAIIGSGKSVLIGGTGDASYRVDKLKRQLKEASSVFDKDNLEKRIAYLSGGIATVKVGAQTDFEKVYFKLKMENAVNSAQNALRGGVIRGGGVDLKKIGEKHKSILSDALIAPYKQIQYLTDNAEVPKEVMDSVISIETALRSACSVASTLITTEVLVALKKDDTKDENQS